MNGTEIYVVIAAPAGFLVAVLVTVALGRRLVARNAEQYRGSAEAARHRADLAAAQSTPATREKVLSR